MNGVNQSGITPIRFGVREEDLFSWKSLLALIIVVLIESNCQVFYPIKNIFYCQPIINKL